MRRITCFVATIALALMLDTTAFADPFSFSTGTPDFRIATAARPESQGKIEIESADDFVLTSRTIIDHASFTGLLFQGGRGEIRDVIVELYHVFPKDSKDPPSGNVPTRVNSPSDVAFEERSSEDSTLHFTVTVLAHRVEAANSVIDGINLMPPQMTGGDGPVAGQEVRIDVVFDEPFDLTPDPSGEHFFFVPQVRLQGVGGNFLWLSAPHPKFAGDLQMWIRNEDLAPDWLRVGTDIVGGTTFNGTFSVSGETQ